MSPVTGRILSLLFEGGLTAAVSWGHRVWGPHWRAEWAGRIVNPTSGGSHRPAIYQTGTPVQARVEVELEGTDGTGTPGTLTARLGALSLEGTVPLSDGSHSVQVTQVGPLDTVITRYVGDATWAVTAASLSTQVDLDNTTHLEIFVVLGPRPSFFADGIWVEALRFLIDQVGLSGFSAPHDVLQRITEHCHCGHSLIYKSGGGYTPFGVTFKGGRFALAAFLQGSSREVQCFDMSAAVLVLAGAVGIAVEWLKIVPFGFLNETDLVGIGRCNSPFFIEKRTGPIVPRLDPNRSYFVIHAFCELSAQIFDACVGPHLGTENGPSYLTSAVDTTNPNGLGVPPVGNIEAFTNLLNGVG